MCARHPVSCARRNSDVSPILYGKREMQSQKEKVLHVSDGARWLSPLQAGLVDNTVSPNAPEGCTT